MELNIYLQPKQRKAFDLSEVTPVLFYGGAKGGGKSYLVRAREVKRRLQYPGSKGLIVRKTYPELLSNHIRQFFKEYPETINWYKAGEKAIYWPGGSITEFSHLSSLNDVYSYQGREYDDISIDEAPQHEEEVYKILRSSLRTTNPLLKPRMLLTGNPGGPGHGWIKRLFIDQDFNENENPEDYGFVQATVWDNKALTNADPDYVKRLKELPTDKRRAYLEGDWTVFSGQVFSEFRIDKHTINLSSTPRKSLIHLLSFDWGYAAPFACYCHVLVDMKTQDGVAFKRLVTWREWYGTEKHPAVWAKEIYEALKEREIKQAFCDPSMMNRKSDGSISIAQEFERKWEDMHDKYWINLEGGSRDRIKRIALTHRWLSLAPDGLPYWVIDKSATNLIRTLPMLVYDDHKVEDINTTQEDHAWDSISYLLGSLVYVPEYVGGLSQPQKTYSHAIVVNDEGKSENELDMSLFEQ